MKPRRASDRPADGAAMTHLPLLPGGFRHRTTPGPWLMTRQGPGSTTTHKETCMYWFCDACGRMVVTCPHDTPMPPPE